MKSSGGLDSSSKKKSSYIFLGFFVIAILCMVIVAWQLGVLN